MQRLNFREKLTTLNIVSFFLIMLKYYSFFDLIVSKLLLIIKINFKRRTF